MRRKYSGERIWEGEKENRGGRKNSGERNWEGEREREEGMKKV